MRPWLLVLRYVMRWSVLLCVWHFAIENSFSGCFCFSVFILGHSVSDCGPWSPLHTSKGSLTICLSAAQCLFLPRKDLPFFLSPVHLEHCSVCSFTGMLKNPGIFVLHLKKELRWAIESFCPKHLNVSFFKWFLEAVQVDWKDGKAEEWIERLLMAPRLVLWGTCRNNVLTVSQGPAPLYCIGTLSVLSGLFFKWFSLVSRKLLQWSQV